jgi:hypothetical protein
MSKVILSTLVAALVCVAGSAKAANGISTSTLSQMGLSGLAVIVEIHQECELDAVTIFDEMFLPLAVLRARDRGPRKIGGEETRRLDHAQAVVDSVEVHAVCVSSVPLRPSAPGGKRINGAAFKPAADSQQGNLGRNAFSGFGMSQLDLALRREFFAGERRSLHKTAEFSHARRPIHQDRQGGLPARAGDLYHL